MLSIKLHAKKIVFVLCLILALWLIFGQKITKIDGKNTTNKNIRSETIKPSQRDIFISSYGILDSDNRIRVYPEISGKVSAKFVNDGSYIKKGAALVAIDVPTLESQLAKAQAAFEQKKMRYESDANLSKKGYVSHENLLASLAGLKAAEDDLNKVRDTLEKSLVKADIAGIVNKINVSEGDFVVAGNTIITEIIGSGDYKVTCYLSEADISKIHNEAEAYVEDKKGTVKFISMISESHTKTYRVDILFEDSVIQNPLGASLSVRIKVDKKDAYKIPGSALVLNDSGELGIKTIIDDIVKFVPIEVISQDSDQFWITQDNIKESEINLITLGANFVKDGDKIMQ